MKPLLGPLIAEGSLTSYFDVERLIKSLRITNGHITTVDGSSPYTEDDKWRIAGDIYERSGHVFHWGVDFLIIDKPMIGISKHPAANCFAQNFIRIGPNWSYELFRNRAADRQHGIDARSRPLDRRPSTTAAPRPRPPFTPFTPFTPPAGAD
jgi:hypothetical protein